MFYMFLHYDVMNHRFITKIDELMNLFIIRQKSPKMQKFIRFITFSKRSSVHQKFNVVISFKNYSSLVFASRKMVMNYRGSE